MNQVQNKKAEKKRENEKQYNIQIVVQHLSEKATDFPVLSEEAILLNEQGVIIIIPPLGPNFNQIRYFNTTIKEKNLALFLSLLYSYHDNIQVQFEDYQLRASHQTIKAQASLIFEKVDEDNALYMRLAQVLPDFPVDTLEPFDLYRYASINELERQIEIRFIDQIPI